MSTGIRERIKNIEDEMARTQINKATMSHICLLRARLVKLRGMVEEAAKKQSGGSPVYLYDSLIYSLSIYRYIAMSLSIFRSIFLLLFPCIYVSLFCMHLMYFKLWTLECIKVGMVSVCIWCWNGVYVYTCLYICMCLYA